MEEKLYIKKQRKYYTSILLKVTASWVLDVFLQYFNYFFVYFFFGPAVSRTSWFAEINNSVSTYIAMPLFLYFHLRKNIKEFKTLNPVKVKLPFKTMFGLVCVIYFFMELGAYIGVAVEVLIALIAGADPSGFTAFQAVVTTEQNPGEVILSVVAAAILAPIFEELIWRKIIAGASSRYGMGPAILISGICFGIWHGNFSQCFYAALCGVIFAFIYLYTKDLKYTIILHMSINAVSAVSQVNGLIVDKLMEINEFESLPAALFKYQFPMMIKQYPIMTILCFFDNFLYDLEFVVAIVGLGLVVVYIIKYIRIRKQLMMGSTAVKIRAFVNWGMLAFVVMALWSTLNVYLGMIFG